MNEHTTTTISGRSQDDIKLTLNRTNLQFGDGSAWPTRTFSMATVRYGRRIVGTVITANESDLWYAQPTGTNENTPFPTMEQAAAHCFHVFFGTGVTA